MARRRRTAGTHRRKTSVAGHRRRRKSTTGAGCKTERWRGMGRVRVCRKKNGAIKSWKKIR